MASTVIGANITIEGEVIADEDVVVQGPVRGKLSAKEGVTVEAGAVGEGAKVVGDVRAPRVSIAPGGLVRGYVETGHAGEGKRASHHAAPRAAPAPVRHAPAVSHAKSAPAKVTHAKAAPAKAASKGRGLTLAGGKAPPP